MQLEQSHVRYIIVSPWLLRAAPQGHEDILHAFWDYMARHYRLLSKFANQDEVSERASRAQK
jgi:hypothetical protein